jgi:hypothetical protein
VARLTVLVVLPLPPLLLDSVIVSISAIAVDPTHDPVKEVVGRASYAPGRGS